MMEKIDIDIRKGRIKSFNVELHEDIPEVTASVGLFTPNEKEVSSFSIGTGKWRGSHFDLPADMVSPIMTIALQLEEIVIRECNRAMAMIEAKKADNDALPF